MAEKVKYDRESDVEIKRREQKKPLTDDLGKLSVP
jgi:hypothetical protein